MPAGSGGGGRPSSAATNSHAPDPDPAAGGLPAALRALPPRQRAALTLRYVHDLDDRDIARALGCRASTVRTLLWRGREALRAAWTTEDEEGNDDAR